MLNALLLYEAIIIAAVVQLLNRIIKPNTNSAQFG